MRAGERVAHGVDRTLWWIEQVLIAVLSLAALCIGIMQVVLRYIFNTGFEWSTAIFVLLTISAMLAAGSRAVRENAHVRVDLLHLLVPRAVARWMDFLAYLAAFALCAFYVWCGILFVEFSKMMDTASPETGFKDWIVNLIMPVAMAMFVIRYVLKLRLALIDRDDAMTQHVGLNEVASSDQEFPQ